jgi:TRAP-type C4-dicarboxylate transport system permease small subunit
MSSGAVRPPAPRAGAPWAAVAMGLARALQAINRGVVALSMLALVLAACVLTYSVVMRYLFRTPTDWQDETAVFLMVGATFLSMAYVQSLRGHIGIDALAAVLPRRVNTVRVHVLDGLSCLFCCFFTWKSAALLHEAWVEGQTTSSTWAAPLWIPYGLMTLGMGLLAAQIALQTATAHGGTPAK